MTGVSTKHPDITMEREYEWRLMRDTYAGQEQIKYAMRNTRHAGTSTALTSRGEIYLPKPNGFAAMPDKGLAAYEAYKLRAMLPEYVAPTVAAMVGIVHGRETQLVMPDAMAFLEEDIDGQGTPREIFHQRITRNLLLMGRYGLLADAPEGGGNPFLRGYSAETIINWDQGFYVLDESHLSRDGFAWELVHRFRVLEIVEGRYRVRVYEGDGGDLVSEAFPVSRGGAAVDMLPFAVATSRDLTPDVETPPLIGVAQAAIAAYQLSADYRHQLYMSGQETLVAINGDAPKAVGAGVVHTMKGSSDLQPDLKYVSPTCSGINAHREAITEQRQAAMEAGARMFQSGQGQESGEARRMRFASEMANLQSIANMSAALLETGLRHVAAFMGLDPRDVVATPPADLLDRTMTPQDLQALFAVYSQGGMSWETYHANGQRGGIMSSERAADEEFALIDGQGGGGDTL
jgi:hypothetical protein